MRSGAQEENLLLQLAFKKCDAENLLGVVLVTVLVTVLFKAYDL